MIPPRRATIRRSRIRSGLIVAATIAAAVTLAGCTPAAPTSVVYSTTKFAIPLKVTVVTAHLAGTANLDSKNLVSWTSLDSDSERVRFVVPAQVYEPGSKTSIEPPSDYLGYLQSLTASGATIADQRVTTIGGVSATEFTLTSSRDLPGSIGCVPDVSKSDANCFGLAKSTSFRMAVLTTKNKTLLIWARTAAATPDDTFITLFEKMLTTVKFR